MIHFGFSSVDGSQNKINLWIHFWNVLSFWFFFPLGKSRGFVEQYVASMQLENEVDHSGWEG